MKVFTKSAIDKYHIADTELIECYLKSLCNILHKKYIHYEFINNDPKTAMDEKEKIIYDALCQYCVKEYKKRLSNQ